MNSKRLCRLWLETNDEDLLKGLRVCKLRTQPGKDLETFQRGKKFNDFIVKSTYLRIISPALTSPRLVQDSYQSDVSGSG